MRKIELEFRFGQISRLSLWKMVSTSDGLSQWFADAVTVDRDQYTFTWSKVSESAKLVTTKEKSSIRFHWDYEDDNDIYFELAVEEMNLTNELILKIIDFAEEDEYNDSINLFNKQVEKLKRLLGVL